MSPGRGAASGGVRPYGWLEWAVLIVSAGIGGFLSGIAADFIRDGVCR